MSRVQWTGLEEFKRYLTLLPDDLAIEGSEIVLTSAREADDQTLAIYPEVSGNLKRRIVLQESYSRFGARMVIRSAAPHSHMYEFGTQRRQTSKGANRGTMPKAPASRSLIPVAMAARQRMMAGLIKLVRAAGFEVSS